MSLDVQEVRAERLEKMQAKVRALLNKASSTEDEHPEEAKTFREAAEKLMAKYSIEWSMVDFQNQEYTSKPTTFIINIEPPYVREFGDLLGMIGKVFNCMVVSRKNREQPKILDFHLLGFQSDIDVVWTLFSSLSSQMNLSLWANTHGMSVSQRKDFLYSYSSKVVIRLDEFYKTAVEESGAGTELVLSSRADEVQKYTKEQFPLVKPARVIKIQNYDAFTLGQNEGSKADISLSSRRLDDEDDNPVSEPLAIS